MSVTDLSPDSTGGTGYCHSQRETRRETGLRGWRQLGRERSVKKATINGRELGLLVCTHINSFSLSLFPLYSFSRPPSLHIPPSRPLGRALSQRDDTNCTANRHAAIHRFVSTSSSTSTSMRMIMNYSNSSSASIHTSMSANISFRMCMHFRISMILE